MEAFVDGRLATGTPAGKRDAAGSADAELGKKPRAAEESEDQKAARVVDLARKMQEQQAAKAAALRAAEDAVKNPPNQAQKI